MDMPVNNIGDLQSEIIRLEKLKQTQEIELKKRFSSPGAAMSAAMSLFPKSAEGAASPSRLFHADFINLLSRLVIPLTLNKTLFKGSGFLVKTLVGLLSQKASDYINEDTVTGTWDKVKAIFGKIKLGKKDKTKSTYEGAQRPEPYITPEV
ncbi:hypothetical protein MUY27_12290 [Mucilaginibacter sp. RS28]|uniref:Uncharacterized protein n=1 Tax=Mucilaginibacter straminoryzae TaxID=2932774 RepID=A0A9X1X3W4_9SPHI|nr:hypothetical protein [Mucilaginibacter straminoryzae]MCJ8210488.1 hypothetical protein [Mucilaginibacter straminoryzae]